MTMIPCEPSTALSKLAVIIKKPDLLEIYLLVRRVGGGEGFVTEESTNLLSGNVPLV